MFVLLSISLFKCVTFGVTRGDWIVEPTACYMCILGEFCDSVPKEKNTLVIVNTCEMLFYIGSDFCIIWIRCDFDMI